MKKAYIADCEPLDYITFIDPRDGQTITGVVWTMNKLNVNRSEVRRFTLKGNDRVFNVAANFHVEKL